MPSPSSGPATGPSQPPRQARALATRVRILEAAAADFAAVGYHGSSLSRILERSRGVTKGALYFHFSSKEAMARAVVAEMGHAYRRVVDEEATENASVDALRRSALLACAVLDLLSRSSSIVRAGERLALEGAAGAEWLTWPTRFRQEAFTALFVEAHEAGNVRPEVDPTAMGRFVCDISHGAFAASLAMTGLADLSDRVCHNWDLMFAFMATEAWLTGWRDEGGMAATMRRPLGVGPGDRGG